MVYLTTLIHPADLYEGKDRICIYLIKECCLNSAFYFTKQLKLSFPLKRKYGTNIKKDTKFTTLIMESLDKKIEMVAFGQINKLDIRGGQLLLPLGSGCT